MIVPMKKLSVLVMDKNREDALERIRDLGVVHLSKKTVDSPALLKLLDRHSHVESALGILDAFAPKKKGKKADPVKLPKVEGDLANHILALTERRKNLQDFVFAHNREISRFSRWGDFDPKDFAYLAGHGVNLYLYELALESYKELAKDVRFIVLDLDKKNNVALIAAFEKIADRLPYPLPEMALSVIEEKHVFQMFEISIIEQEIAALSSLKGQLEDEKNAVLGDIEFEIARAGMELIEGDAGAANLSVSWISGFAPASDMGAIKRAASENGWAFCALDPAQDDEVPTKLKNNSFVKLIYPVTDFLEMIPGYRERDISLWFLVFFTLFFAMIFGDAAYGAVLLIISFIGIAKTAKKGVPLGFKFLLLMSIFNIIWGALVCSWFGLDTAQVPQILQNLSLPLIARVSFEPGWLASYNAGNYWIQSGLVAGYTTTESLGKVIDTNMMLFCFSIALVQLGIAHISKAIDYIRSPRILGEIGQIGILFGMYFVVLSLIVFNTGFEGVKLWQWCVVAGGFALVFVFGSYEGSVLKSVLTSCSNFITVVLNITNVFSDIMSYIRLWAVGLAAASIAGIINDFASPMFSRLAFFIFAIAFFAFGHGFNMVLNVLSILVHGVRLNTLEFSTHIGVSWSGFAYKPFAKRQ